MVLVGSRKGGRKLGIFGGSGPLAPQPVCPSCHGLRPDGGPGGPGRRIQELGSSGLSKNPGGRPCHGTAARTDISEHYF
jgi:hypothetical protein